MCTGSSSSPKEDLLTVSQITDSDVAREIEDLSQVHPSQKLPVADSQLSGTYTGIFAGGKHHEN